ncbi:GNAT family N-acetyltransferase [Ideonella margarita]|uniref:GNAT family N-acetyltransferase n=1 Tax=Ideonella margarita TaxID=2984191 RepID=A0ABU9C7V8_9BURK
MSLVIRELNDGDVAAYRSLMLEAYATVPDAFTSTPEERAAEPDSWWIKRMRHPAGLGLAFGAFDGDALVGTVALEFANKPKTRHKGLVIGMVVQEAVRGQGAGRALMDAALIAARARPGLRSLILTATEGNEPAIRLYRSCGFVAFGTEPLAILTPTGFRSKVHMVLDLHPNAPVPGM